MKNNEKETILDALEWALALIQEEFGEGTEKNYWTKTVNKIKNAIALLN